MSKLENIKTELSNEKTLSENLKQSAQLRKSELEDITKELLNEKDLNKNLKESSNLLKLELKKIKTELSNEKTKSDNNKLINDQQNNSKIKLNILAKNNKYHVNN